MKNNKLKIVERMSACLILGCLALGLLFGQKPASTPEFEIVVDPRVELMSIIFRLAGNNEYNQPGVIPYVENIRKHFDRFKDHPAAAMAKDLRKNSFIGFDAPMFLAIYLTDAIELKERVPFETPGVLDNRWNAETVRGFLKEIRRFVEDTHFIRFFKDNQKLYDIAVERAEEFVRSEVHLEWFGSYFGTQREGDFILSLTLNNGGPSYGPSFRHPDGDVEYHCILGLPYLDEDQLPIFGDKDLRDLEVIIHEFCHSFVNPLVDKHKSEMKALGDKLFPLVESVMRSQAYGNWETMMRETFVRACVLRYIHAYKGQEAAKKGLETELALRFILVEKLYDVLGEYEKQKDRYSSLDSFFPKLVATLNEFVEKPEELEKINKQLEGLNARRREAAKKRLEELRAHPEKLPKVITTVPADGDMNVDPDLEEIRIVFDRPMKKNTLFIPVANTKKIEWTGKAGWESQSTVYWFSTKLEPDTEYGYGLNSEDAQLFADENGKPLLPVIIRFKTRSEASGEDAGFRPLFQDERTEIINLFNGRLKIIPLYKTQMRIFQEIITLDQVMKKSVLINSLYNPFKELWEGYLGDRDDFISWVEEKALKSIAEYRAVSERFNSSQFQSMLIEIASNMSLLTGHFPQGIWYLFFGPGWTDMGGLGNGIMLVDLGNKTIEFDYLKFMLPHELNHQIYDKTNPFDLNAGTVLYRCINEGFASYLNYIFWEKKYSPAKNLLYGEEKFQWCMANEEQIYGEAAKLFSSKSRADIDRLVARHQNLIKNGPGAIGYFIGFRICEEYTKKHGRDSWKDIYTLPVAELIERCGIDF